MAVTALAVAAIVVCTAAGGCQGAQDRRDDAPSSTPTSKASPGDEGRANANEESGGEPSEGAKRDVQGEDGSREGTNKTGAGEGADSGASPPSQRNPSQSELDRALRDPVTQLGLGSDELNTIAVYERVAPATVYVSQTQLVRDTWSMETVAVPAGSGTGFVWDSDGHIVTNFHVVAGARGLTVTTHDGTTRDAAFVGGDPYKDIAVLKIALREGEQLTTVTLPGEDEALRVGQKALAIGNPFGLDHTLTVGVVSAIGREVRGFGGITITGMIQTDADINPGNSGGPLLDSSGRVIGMNTMIFSQSGGSAGIGFAVPSSTIRRLVPELIQYGQPVRAGIGITIVDDQVARANRIDGAIIDRVEEKSPAAAAGLRGLSRERGAIKLGDIIIGVDDAVVHSWADLIAELQDKRPGDAARFTLRRGELIFEREIVLSQVQ